MRKMINETFIGACRKFLQPEQIMLNAPMSEHTTFQIGGPADCLLKPANLEETQKILQLVQEYELPLTFVGNGSNMLVSDKGIRGVVVNFADTISSIAVDGTKMTVGAGALDSPRGTTTDEQDAPGEFVRSCESARGDFVLVIVLREASGGRPCREIGRCLPLRFSRSRFPPPAVDGGGKIRYNTIYALYPMINAL